MIALLLLCLAAHALPGLMLGRGPVQPQSPAAAVMLLRDGARTVVAIQPSYVGPGEDFVWLLPVPAGVRRDQIVANGHLHELFSHLDYATAPQLIALEQRDPCPPPAPTGPARLVSSVADSALGPPEGTGPRIAVQRWRFFRDLRAYEHKVERRVAASAKEMASSEYDMELLPSQGSAVPRWLRRHGYPVNQRVKDLLRWSAAPDMSMLVARVSMDRVTWYHDHYTLRPVLYIVEDDTFRFNVDRNLSSGETGRWTLYVIGPSRYEVAKRRNAVVASNLSVRASASLAFDPLYQGLVRRARGKRSETTVTEWVGRRGPCERHPMESFNLERLYKAVGTDALTPPPYATPLTLTRLSLLASQPRETLTFVAAPPIEAGVSDPDLSGQLSTAVTPSEQNHMRARYMVLRPWSKPSSCEAPRSLWIQADLREGASKVLAQQALSSLYPPVAQAADLEELILSPLP